MTGKSCGFNRSIQHTIVKPMAGHRVVLHLSLQVLVLITGFSQHEKDRLANTASVSRSVDSSLREPIPRAKMSASV